MRPPTSGMEAAIEASQGMRDPELSHSLATLHHSSERSCGPCGQIRTRPFHRRVLLVKMSFLPNDTGSIPTRFKHKYCLLNNGMELSKSYHSDLSRMHSSRLS